MKQQTTTDQADSKQKEPEALDFSADNMDWSANTAHLDEIVEETIDTDTPDKVTGLKPSETLSEEEFFTDFFCQNMALAEQMTGMVGVSVVWSNGEPEPGARQTSNLLYRQCQKFKFVAWALKRDGTYKDMFAIAMFVSGKIAVVSAHREARKKAKEDAAKNIPANDNAEPLEDTA